MTGYIQGYSKVRASYNSSNVTLKHGASVSKWTVKFGSASAVDVAAGTSTKDSSSTISAATTVVCTVTDSRGFTASETLQTTIIPYENPALTATIKRADSNGTEDDGGTYLRIDLAGWYSDIDGQNSQTSVVRRKLASSGSFGTDVEIDNGSTTQTGTRKLYSAANFLVSGMTDAVYNVEVEITDALGNKAKIAATIESQAWAIHFRNQGAGAAMGKAAERDSELDIGNWKLTCGDAVIDGLSSVNSYGSNANGYYCKLPNGTLICWGIFTQTVTTSNYSQWGSWYAVTFSSGISFPATFISEPSVCATSGNTIWGFVPSAIASASSITSITFCRYNAYAAEIKLRWIAIGRWK